MPMQVRHNHRERFPGFRAGKGAGNGPLAAEWRPARFCGAPKNSYVKFSLKHSEAVESDLHRNT